MKLETVADLARSGQLGVLLALPRVLRPYYRLCFLAAGAASGVFARLAAGPAPIDRLAAELAPDPTLRRALEAWLGVGVTLGELRLGRRGYELRGALAKRLAAPEHDAAAAMIEEAAELHHALILETPARLRAGRRFTLADQRGEVVARSSRLLEPVVGEAVRQAVPARGAVRLLEIGCGSGCYLYAAAARNPRLTALALELQPDVAEVARGNVAAWGIADRVTVETGDVRERRSEPTFDLATLHNNIYYFPVDGRVLLLRHVRGFLKRGGKLLLTTGCRGGSVTMQVLDLWGAITEGCGPLPSPEEMVAQLRQAGFTKVQRRRLVPGESYWAFVAET